MIGHMMVVGGGLAGSEAAWQAAQRGVAVTLYEMRPVKMTPAHLTDGLAELVCSNSLGSDLLDRAPGLLKAELRKCRSLILECADRCAVPAGGALAVGREAFSRAVSDAIGSHPRIEVRREEIRHLGGGELAIFATGPLTSDHLAKELAFLGGEEHLYFFDAMAPIVRGASVDMSRAFRASRYDRGEADYINCPLDREEYDRFVDELVSAERTPLRDFERDDPRFFEACLPLEVLAARGREALAFGPLRPVGLWDPVTGGRPYAVVQLRQDDLAGTLYNLVGFQTSLKWEEQRRVFGLVPALRDAEWVRFGQMHRNTYLNSPRLLDPTMKWRGADSLYFAGQMVGTEGYMGSTASGLVAGINAARQALGEGPAVWPRTTMTGALMHYVTHCTVTPFQPMKANFGLMPPLEEEQNRRRARNAAYAERSLVDLEAWIAESGVMSDLVASEQTSPVARQTP